jgi:hypothetical protein
VEAYGRRQLTRQCRPARCGDPAKPPRPAGGAANSGRAARNLGSARVGTYLLARYLLGLSSPRAEPYTGIGVDSTFLSAWSIIDGCTLQTRFLEILRIFGTTTTRHMITRLSSLYSPKVSMEGMRAWLHITSQLTARTGVVYFASHRTILYAPSTASYIRFVLRARTHSTDSLRPSSPCRVSVHSGTCSVRRSVEGAHAHAHALHPCTVCPRACRDKGSRVLGSWACKFTRLESRRLRSRTRNGRVHASAGLRGHQLRLFESCGCLKRPLAPTTLPHCHGTALQKEAAYRDDRTSNHAPQRRHMAALPFCNGSSAIPLTSHDVLNQTHRFRGSYV